MSFTGSSTVGDEDDDDDSFGITFNIKTDSEMFGGEPGGSETNPKNPDCFAWCVMNVCISKILQQVVRKLVAGVGLELLGNHPITRTCRVLVL